MSGKLTGAQRIKMAHGKTARRRVRPPVLYVAVVADSRRAGDVIKSGRPGGDYQAFIGSDRTAVVSLAMQRAARYGASSVDGLPYQVLVGQITDVASWPVTPFALTGIWPNS